MRAVHAIPLAVAAFSVSCSEIPPPVDARVHFLTPPRLAWCSSGFTYASMSYVLTLHIGRLPEELKDLQGVVSVYKVSPHFHPGHHVYEL